MRELHPPTDLDTVGLRVEGPAVVELQDDERERVRLPHLLVVIQRWTLGTRETSVLRISRTKVFVLPSVFQSRS